MKNFVKENLFRLLFFSFVLFFGLFSLHKSLTQNQTRINADKAEVISKSEEGSDFEKCELEVTTGKYKDIKLEDYSIISGDKIFECKEGVTYFVKVDEKVEDIFTSEKSLEVISKSYDLPSFAIFFILLLLSFLIGSVRLVIFFILLTIINFINTFVSGIRIDRLLLAAIFSIGNSYLLLKNNLRNISSLRSVFWKSFGIISLLGIILSFISSQFWNWYFQGIDFPMNQLIILNSLFSVILATGLSILLNDILGQKNIGSSDLFRKFEPAISNLFGMGAISLSVVYVFLESQFEEFNFWIGAVSHPKIIGFFILYLNMLITTVTLLVFYLKKISRFKPSAPRKIFKRKSTEQITATKN